MKSSPAFERPRPVARLADTTLRSEGESSVGLRRAVADRAAELAGAASAPGEEIPEALRRYVDKVAQHAYRITDEDVEALRAAGYSEDLLFEITVSAAVAAGLARLDRGLEALRKAGS